MRLYFYAFNLKGFIHFLITIFNKYTFLTQLNFAYQNIFEIILKKCIKKCNKIGFLNSI